MNYKLELTREEIVLIGATLAKLPFESVAPLIIKIQHQVDLAEAHRASQGAPAESVENVVTLPPAEARQQ